VTIDDDWHVGQEAGALDGRDSSDSTPELDREVKSLMAPQVCFGEG
jgi:hypothetical protein